MTTQTTQTSSSSKSEEEFTAPPLLRRHTQNFMTATAQHALKLVGVEKAEVISPSPRRVSFSREEQKHYLHREMCATPKGAESFTEKA
jgi:hypothetical protein